MPKEIMDISSNNILIQTNKGNDLSKDSVSLGGNENTLEGNNPESLSLSTLFKQMIGVASKESSSENNANTNSESETTLNNFFGNNEEKDLDTDSNLESSSKIKNSNLLSLNQNLNPIQQILAKQNSIEGFDIASEINDFEKLSQLDKNLTFENNELKLNGKVVQKSELINYLKNVKSTNPLEKSDLSQIIGRLEKTEKVKSLQNTKKNNIKNVLESTPTLSNVNVTKPNSSSALNTFKKNQQPFSDKIINIKNLKSSEKTTEGAEKLSLVDLQSNEIDHAKTKEFSFNNVSEVKAENKTALINNISNYIERNSVKLESGIELTVKHNELGQFKIKAENSAQGVELQLTSMNKHGHEFFVQNKTALETTLRESGIKLSDLKVVMSSDKIISMNTENQKSGFNFTGNNSSQNGNQSNGFMSGSFQQNEGNQKRQELWNKYKEQFNKFAS